MDIKVFLCRHVPLLALICLLWSCQGRSIEEKAGDAAVLSWEQIESRARGATVNLMMWAGDPLINAYMQNYVRPALKERYGIELAIANGQGSAIVQNLMAELQAGKAESELDLMWINGETFYQLRQLGALYGPWTDQLPNAGYIDFGNPFIGVDFQQPVDGFECPWGNVQMAFIYDSLQVSDPPQNRAELLAFVRANPGRFTIDNQFTGLAFLKACLIDIAGGAGSLNGPFDEAKYNAYAPQLWQYFRQMKPYLWKEGRTYPEGVAPMHQMFANGELWFTMSYNDNEVDNKILQGLFPESARAYAWETGTIQNAHYLGISRNSPNKAAAMVVCNFLISPEAQYRKQDPAVWGDGTVLAMDKLPEEWREKFRALPNRRYAPPRKQMQERALRELAPEYMIRLAEDFRKEIIQ
ncbi:MAG: ABC transporter substrate-binding protein [Lewinellaceae bacterium]|nr:ABC transporter substrate-binding protein [Phaeodactylibacter sp.]MCB9042063.1 ABC transporter substrate-binding protein [Lewinellaceae bacterium]